MASGNQIDSGDGRAINSKSRSVNVPLPAKLDLHGGSLDQSWKKFKRSWRNYLVASRVGEESHDFQTAVFLSCIGDDANDVYDGFDFEPGQERNMDAVLAKFESFCVGQTNEVYESYKFFKRSQEPGETVDCYVAVLRRMIKNCNYGSTQIEDRILRDRVVAGVTNDTIRQKFLQENGLSLKKCIDIARVHETSTAQAKAMGEEQIHKLHTKTGKKPAAGGGPPGGMSGKHKGRQTVSRNSCKFCGYKHKHGRQFCPAWGEACRSCDQKNHFLSCCPNSHKANILQDQDSDSQSEDEIDNAVFMCLSETNTKKSESETNTKKSESETNKKKSESGTKTKKSDSGTKKKKSEHETNAKKSERETLAKKSESETTCAREREIVQVCDVENSVHAKMIVNDVEVVFQLDSGATINSMSLSLYKKVTGDHALEKIMPCKKTLVMYDKSTIKPVGEITLQVINPKNNDEFKVRFIIVKEAVRPILGCRAVQLMKLLTVNFSNISVVNAEPVHVVNVVNDFDDVFEGEIGTLEGNLGLVIDKTVPSVKLPCRRWPNPVKEKVRVEIERLEGLGVVEKVTQPTDWISSLVVTMKPNGQARLCIDPKPLNKAIMRNHYPMRTLDDVIEELAGAEFFTHLDARNGFWHVKLTEKSKHLTTFETPFGKYCWKRMPFGISSAPEEFQRRMDEALAGLPGVFAVHDDIILWGKKQENESASDNHDKNLRGLLQRCREKGIKLNKEKLELKQREISYLGHTISRDGVKADPKKVDAIKKLETPKDKQGVQRILGVVGYLQKFAPHLSGLSAPLRDLIKKDVNFRWDEDVHGAALEKIKQTLSEPPVLRFFDSREENVVLQCDASNFGLGACLMQNNQPVQYASRSLTQTEQNYAQIEKEMLAIVFGLERFERFVYGKLVEVESDHKPLEAIHKKSLLSAPKRLQRMLMRTQKFDYTVRYKKGAEMYIADTLSRAVPVEVGGKPEEKEEIFQTSVEKELESINMAAHVAVSPAKLEELQNATKADEDLQQLMTIVQEGWPEERKQVPYPLQAYFPFREEISFQNGLLFKGERIIVPEQMRNYIAELLHQAHQGYQSCLRRAREVVYWPGMGEHLQQLVGKCSTCQTFQSAQAKEPMIAREIPEIQWQYVACDLFEYAGNDYMVLVDYHSDFFEVDRLDKKTSAEVIFKMKAHFARHGIPEELVSDNAGCFDSREFEKFVDTWGFEHNPSSPLYAQSNGKAENAVKQAKNLMKKAAESKSDVYLALLTLRNTPTEDMKTSPAQRLFSRRTRTLVPSARSLLKPQVCENVEQKLIDKKKKQADAYNRHTKELSTLQPGQVVRVRAGDRWVKSKVEEQVDVRSYKIQTENGRVYRRNRRQLRPTLEQFQTQNQTNIQDKQEKLIRKQNDHAFKEPTETQHQNMFEKKQTEAPQAQSEQQSGHEHNQYDSEHVEAQNTTRPTKVSSWGRAIRKPSRYVEN